MEDQLPMNGVTARFGKEEGLRHVLAVGEEAVAECGEDDTNPVHGDDLAPDSFFVLGTRYLVAQHTAR